MADTSAICADGALIVYGDGRPRPPKDASDVTVLIGKVIAEFGDPALDDLDGAV